jgi:hypothetical protein
MGRIYRIVHKDFKPDRTKPNMLNQPASELVQYLDRILMVGGAIWRNKLLLFVTINRLCHSFKRNCKSKYFAPRTHSCTLDIGGAGCPRQRNLV